ncbi:MAG TPA: four helix bundle protein [Gemmatimonadales bacterium]|nr:four helix bundle protein [Gemmatimonadales bacterium]
MTRLAEFRFLPVIGAPDLVGMATRPETANNSKPHERLTAWAACHDLVVAVYRATADWPPPELHGLGTQARRASVSAAANIAEGAAKRGSREFRRYLDIAFGSLTELECLLLIARDVNVLSPAAFGELEALRDHASRLTWGLYRAMRRAATRQAG